MTRAALNRSDDAGLTLIEVMVAMFVFALISIGVALSITSSLLLTTDTRSREIAANLAAQEIDLDRSASNVFAVTDTSWTTVVNGTTFTIVRGTDWVSTNNSTVACGAGGGTLQFKKVNISVTWSGMRTATAAVRADTLIAPNNRINDPTLGTIIVSVKSASGAGTPGVVVSVAPSSVPNGAVPLTTVPAPTDADGCTYALKVTPGNYDVSLSVPNYLDIHQKPAPVLSPVQVTAGTAQTAPFTYDNGALYSVQYASSTATRPTNLDLSWVNPIGGTFVQTIGSATTSRLFPFSDGYAVLAGAYVAPIASHPNCLSVDPSAWTTPAVDGAVGRAVQAGQAAPPGQTITTLPIPMGVVTVNGLGNNTYLTAVAQAPVAGTGDPGCTTANTYTFPKLTSGSSMTVALPFGAWRFYTGNSSGSTSSTVPTTSIALVTRGVMTPAVQTITLDPRQVGP
ncbi:prepilin-type N-terminal cleavage/methylation domain-containing protein [Leifsonia sp. NPDC102414]|uniref:type IV pilus modification PilV family protein n=1 Tax=Leifsonia sp. NPDC102414 TaxID=3364124 RepID=UPI00381AFB98